MKKILAFLLVFFMASPAWAIELYQINDTYNFYCVVHDTSGSVVSADRVNARIYEETTGAAIIAQGLTELDKANALGVYVGSVALSAANGFEDGKNYCVVYSASADSQSPAAVERFRMSGHYINAIQDAVNPISDDLATTHTAVDQLAASQDRIRPAIDLLSGVSGDIVTTHTAVDTLAVSQDRIRPAIDLLSGVSPDIVSTHTAIDTAVSPTSTGISGAVWIYDISAMSTEGQAGAELNDITNFIPTSNDNAAGVWAYDISGITTEGQAGEELNDLSNLMLTSADIWNYDISGITTEGLAGAELNDITNYIPTSADNADAVWDESSTGHAIAGRAGYQLWTVNNAILDDTGTNGVIVQTINSGARGLIIDEMWHAGTASHDYAGSMGLALGNAGSPASAAEVADAVWHAGRASHDFAGSFGAGVVIASIDATASDTFVDDIWDEDTADHSTAGSMGKALSDAGAAGDPWSTVLDGSDAYTGNMAGERLFKAFTSADAVETRLTSARAGFLDYLNSATGGSIAQLVSYDEFRTSMDILHTSFDELKGSGWNETDDLRDISLKVKSLRR